MITPYQLDAVFRLSEMRGALGPDVRCLLDLVDELRTELSRRGAMLHRAGDEHSSVWMYQGDEEDHLESLVCPLLIEADVARRVLPDLAPVTIDWVENISKQHGLKREVPIEGDERCVIHIVSSADQRRQRAAVICVTHDPDLNTEPVFKTLIRDSDDDIMPLIIDKPTREDIKDVIRLFKKAR